MPLSFEKFQGEGVFGVSSYYTDSHKIRFNQNKTGTEEEEDLGYVFRGGLQEPTSVLDALRSPSPLASHSSTTTNTTLSSSHGGGAVTATAIAGDDKCSQMGLDDLDGVLSASSPSQEQSILRLIMDPGSGFGVLDPGFDSDPGQLRLLMVRTSCYLAASRFMTKLKLTRLRIQKRYSLTLPGQTV